MAVTEKIKIDGLRASKNMDEVFSILKNNNSPVTVEYIYDKIKKKSHTISLSTVYRIIDKLVNKNIIKKTMILDDNKAMYELIKDKHQHYMVCTKCKKMIPIDVCPIEEFEKNIAGQTGFNITGHNFELYGECKDCCSKDSKI